MFKIKSIKARKILDSRANWTVAVDLETPQGLFQDSFPSGASKGKYEAPMVSFEKAVKNINELIAPKLKGKDPTKQKEIDNFLEPEKFGANATTPVSLAVCRAGASAKNLPLYKYIAEIYRDRLSPYQVETGSLPTPCFNVINGGAHAGNELDFQEFMIVPQSKTFSKDLQIATEIYQELKKIIQKKYIDLAINVGDEGGFAPPVRAPEEALNLILEAAKNLGYQKKFHPHTKRGPGAKGAKTNEVSPHYGVGVKIILDVAASQFYHAGKYKMKIGTFTPLEIQQSPSLFKGSKAKPPNGSVLSTTKFNGKFLTGFTKEGLLNYYSDLIKKYPILGLEDPFAEDDWEGWQKLTYNLQLTTDNFLIIGDDLLVTNPKRIKMAKEKEACNAVIIKINQIGTISEALKAVRLAKSYNWKIMVSHRSGETNDDFIADFSVGIGADFIKAGAPARGERVAKYNRLLEIEKELQ